MHTAEMADLKAILIGIPLKRYQDILARLRLLALRGEGGKNDKWF